MYALFSFFVLSLYLAGTTYVQKLKSEISHNYKTGKYSQKNLKLFYIYSIELTTYNLTRVCLYI